MLGTCGDTSWKNSSKKRFPKKSLKGALRGSLRKGDGALLKFDQFPDSSSDEDSGGVRRTVTMTGQLAKAKDGFMLNQLPEQARPLVEKLKRENEELQKQNQQLERRFKVYRGTVADERTSSKPLQQILERTDRKKRGEEEAGDCTHQQQYCAR